MNARAFIMKSPALLQHQHSSASDFVYSCTGQHSTNLPSEPGCCSARLWGALKSLIIKALP